MSDTEEKKVEDATKKLSVEDKERLMARLQKDIKIYEDSAKSFSGFEEIALKHIEFTRALLYGIFYGLVGNLAVQYSFPFYDGIISARYDMMYWLSAILFFGAVIAILLVTIKLNDELETEKEL